MSERYTRQQLYDLAWAEPLRSLSVRFGISDVALKKTCAKAHIPTPERGYWAKKDAGRTVLKRPLPDRPPAMEDEVLIAGRKDPAHYRFGANNDLFEPIPSQPVFETSIESVRERIAKAIGKIKVPREVRVWHPAIQRLLNEDEERRRRQPLRPWEKPLFDAALDRRRLRLLNSLFVATDKFNGKPSRERDTNKTIIGFYRYGVTIVFAPTKRPNRGPTPKDKPLDNDLTLSILEGFHSALEVRSWSDSAEQKLENQLAGIATEIVLYAEVLYRAGAVHQYEWCVKQKADLEERRRRAEVASEKAEIERIKRLEQAKIDRLLLDATAFRQAATIREYAQRIGSAETLRSDVSESDLARWTQWALAQADRIDPSLAERFLEGFKESL